LHKTENSLREGQGKGARQKGGIGFYSYNQIKNTRPAVRKAEAHIWGSAEPHTIGFIFGVCLIGIGAFAVHVGVIYYSRKLCRWASAGRRHPK
jgi:hypothetical protein